MFRIFIVRLFQDSFVIFFSDKIASVQIPVDVDDHFQMSS